MNKPLYLILVGIMSTPLFTQAITPTASTMQLAVVERQSDKTMNGVWIDVRSAREFAQGHLKNAVNIPYDEIADKIATLAPNKEHPIHLYCRSGNRANIALQTLKTLGYHNVINHGGYEDLLKQGLQ